MSNRKFKLTKEQAKIVSSKERKKVVVAGPGTGKTTLLEAIVEAKSDRKDSKKCLFLTFSKQAQEDARERLGDYGQVDVMTLNAFGNRLIRNHWQELGYSKPAKHIDNQKAEKLLSKQFDETFAYSGLDKKQHSELRKITLACFKKGWDVLKVVEDHHPKFAKQLDRLESFKKAFVDTKRKEGIATFRDQIVVAGNLLWKYHKTRKAISKRYHTLLVDEFQDLNDQQLRIVYALAREIPNVVAVGDDAQSIYRFMGAKSQGFEGLKERFKDAEYFCLTYSHRCTQQILDVANAIRKRIKGVIPATLVSDREGKKPRYVECGSAEAQDQTLIRTVNTLRDKHGVPYSQMTVLARSYQSLFEVYRALQRANIPCLVGNQDMLNKICDNVKLMLQVVYGEEEQIGNLLEAFDLEPSHDNEQAVKALVYSKSHGAKESNNTQRLIHGIKKARGSDTIERKLRIIQECIGYYMGKLGKKWLLPYMSQIGSRIRHAQTLEQMLGAIDEYRKENSSKVSLQTIHKSKGLEYEAVFIIDMVDWYFPHEKAMEQLIKGKQESFQDELKLFYVAVTRAKDWLVMMNTPYHDKSSNGHCGLMNRAMLKGCKKVRREFNNNQGNHGNAETTVKLHKV